MLARPTTWHWVVAIAETGLSTPEVYREVDRQRAALLAPPALEAPDDLMAALRQKDPEVLADGARQRHGSGRAARCGPSWPGRWRRGCRPARSPR